MTVTSTRSAAPSGEGARAAVADGPRSPGAGPDEDSRRSRQGARRFLPTGRAWGAAVSGLVTCFAFPPWGWWPLAFVGVAALALVVRDRRCKPAYGLGIAYALGFLLPLLVWSKVAGIDAWLLLTVSQSLLLAIIGPLSVLAQRRRFSPLWIAGAWMVEEAIRDRVPFGGFPWGRLAFSQSDSPLTALAAWGGAPLLSFVVALGGGLLVVAIRAVSARSAASARPRAGFTAGAAVVGLLAITFAPLLIPRPTGAQRGTAVVAAVQGSVPRTGLDALGQKRAVTRNHVNETLRLAADVKAGKVPAPDLVLWPENSSDLDPFHDATDAALLSSASAAIGRPILVGAVLQGPGKGHVRNTGLLWDASGYLGQMYIKRHPVPFAEYLPGRSIIQKIVTRYAHDQPEDFVAGGSVGIFNIPGPAQTYRLGDVICFEVAYDGLVRSTVTHGAQLIVVQTNNASFGRSGETYQQLAMGRIRAVEHGRAVVVAATSGLSAIISPNGSLVERSSLFTPQALVASVPLRTSLTVADRLGGWTELTLVVLGTLGLVSAIRWPQTRVYGVFGRRFPRSIPARRDEGEGTSSDH